jgi:hypothetical protein
MKVKNFTLEKLGKVKVVFKDELDLSDSVDFINNFQVDNNYVSLNSNILDKLKGKRARITFYNIDVKDNPVIFYNNVFSSSFSDTNEICPVNLCSNIEFNVNTISFDVEHFSTYLIKDSSLKMLDLELADNLIIPLSKKEKYIDETFYIKNNGLIKLDLNLLYNFLEENLTGIFNQVSLFPGQSVPLKIQGELSKDYDIGSFNIGNMRVYGSGINKSVDFFIQYKNMIEFEKLDFIVNNYVYENIDENDDLFVLEGDEVELVIELKNLFSNQDLEDGFLEILIIDSNGNQNIVKTFKIEKIESGEIKKYKIPFIIPSNINSNSELKIKIRINDKVLDSVYYDSFILPLIVNNTLIIEPYLIEKTEIYPLVRLNQKPFASKKISYEKIILIEFILISYLIFILIIIYYARIRRLKQRVKRRDTRKRKKKQKI